MSMCNQASKERLAILILPILLLTLFANASAKEWIEYPHNPVYDPPSGDKAYYPSVLKIGRIYKMWYAKEDGIGYATSFDGIHWREGRKKITGLAKDANHPLVEYDAKGFKKSRRITGKKKYKYRMWYWDPNVQGVPYSINGLRYAESKNGIKWVNDQPITQVGNTMVTGNAGDWNAGTYGPCDVFYNPKGANRIIESVDAKSVWANRFVMYYDATTGADEAIGLAVSADGKHWHGYNNGAGPVFAGTYGSNDWDKNYVTRCTVFFDGAMYHMWYSGGVDTMNHGIGYAISPDGIDWTRDLNNPIFHKDDGVSWRSERTYCPVVIGRKMWFSGKDANGNYTIGYARIRPSVLAASPSKPNISENVGFALGKNYPNPFNPETWIPYQLAKPAEVTIKIYNVSGHLIQTLDIGQKPAGVYIDRSKAGYWDGRNDRGERVSSGTYFYHLQAGDYNATRQMAILK